MPDGAASSVRRLGVSAWVHRGEKSPAIPHEYCLYGFYPVRQNSTIFASLAPQIRMHPPSHVRQDAFY